MKSFLEASCVRPAKHYVIPLVLGRNRIELSSYISSIMDKRGATTTHIVVEKTPKDPFALDNSNLTTAIFTRGEHLTEEIQRGFVSGRFQHLTGVIVVLEHNPLEKTSTTNEVPALTWTKGFLECCTARLFWPKWSQRKADWTRIFAEIHNRLSVPEGRKKPNFDGNVAKLLNAMPFKGSDDAETFFKRALTRYIQSGEDRDFVVQDFISTEDLNGISTLKSKSSPPPILQSA